MSKFILLIFSFIFIINFGCVSDSKDTTIVPPNEEFIIITEKDEYLINETFEVTYTTRNLKDSNYKIAWSTEVGRFETLEIKNIVYYPEENFVGNAKIFLNIYKYETNILYKLRTYTKEIEFKPKDGIDLRPNAVIDKTIQNYYLGTKYELNGEKSYDVNGFNLEYKWEIIKKPVQSNLELNNINSKKIEIEFDAVGEYQFSLIVKNLYSSSFATFTTLNITDEKPVMPVANASENVYLKNGDKPYFHANFSKDSNTNEKLRYLWQITSKPNNAVASITNPNSVSSYLEYDKSGLYKIELTVYDKSNLFSTDEVIVEIVDNYDQYFPIAYSGKNQLINKNIFTTFSAENSKNSHFYKWELIKKPYGSYSEIESVENIENRIKPDKKGEYQIRLLTFSSNDESREDILKLFVVNSVPTVKTDRYLTLYKGQLVILNLYDSDTDLDSLTYHWKVIEKPISANYFISDIQVKNPEFQAFTVGTYKLEVYASDSEDRSETATLTINVN